MVMTHTEVRNQVVQKIELKQTDGWAKPIVLPSLLMWSVTRLFITMSTHYAVDLLTTHADILLAVYGT